MRVLAILLILIAAQVHVCVEAGPLWASNHACQLCVSGVWAILSAHPSLSVTLVSLPLEVERPQSRAESLQIESSAPRAPPCT